MKRSVLLVTGVMAVLAVGALRLLKFEPAPPRIEVVGVEQAVGRHVAFDVVASARGRPAVRHIDVGLRAGDRLYALGAEDLPARDLFDRDAGEKRLRIEADLVGLGVPEGPATIEVFADTHAWQLAGPRGARLEVAVEVDVTPPTVQLLTTQHNIRLGGSSLAVFRVGVDATEAGVAVEDYYFPARRGFFVDPDVALAFFAVPQDLSAAAQPLVRVVDAVGNRREVALPSQVRERQFPTRTLQISDDFLRRKMPEIFASVGRPMPDDPVQAYLYVNRDLRRESEERLLEITASSAAAPLWDGPFHRQSNAAPMSAFADRRSYEYRGEILDRQTHLGYDLASLRRAPVEATQDGVVVFGGTLGIYGETVVLDHGLGLFSLYGHLSTIAVTTGQRVRRGEPLGQTGETGLAGGDHLHFSILLHGVHVDPVEWWDPKWIRDHVAPKLDVLPHAPTNGNEAGGEGSDAEAGT